MKYLIIKILKEELNNTTILENTVHKKRGLLTESTTVDGIQFQDLYDQLWDKMLYGVCMKYTNDKNKAEDFCQNGFIKVFKNLHKYESTGSIEGWVSRIIRNNILDELRVSKRMSHHSTEETNWSTIDTNEVPYEEEYSVEKIEEVLPKLSPMCRTVFELYYFKGMSHGDISKRLGTTIGTSKSNLFKARKKVRDLLNI